MYRAFKRYGHYGIGTSFVYKDYWRGHHPIKVSLCIYLGCQYVFIYIIVDRTSIVIPGAYR